MTRREHQVTEAVFAHLIARPPPVALFSDRWATDVMLDLVL